jgi:hypothetical protein
MGTGMYLSICEISDIMDKAVRQLDHLYDVIMPGIYKILYPDIDVLSVAFDVSKLYIRNLRTT